MAVTSPLNALLGIRHPILLGPMDGVAGARLTAAVSKAGGFGILGGGYGNKAWLEQETRKMPTLAPGASFGVGFITWSLAKQPHLLDVALEAKPRAIMLSFGDPKLFAHRIKASGALLICQIQTDEGAKEALDAGADVLVAQGTEAGGHGGSRGTMSLVPAIVDLAAGRVPVVAAGGIADGRGLAASIALGAAGVLMGTRFYASQEADGPDECKRRICAASGGDTTRGLLFDITRQNVWPGPYTGRCLTNDLVRRWGGREVELMQHAGAVAAEYDAAKAAGNYDIAAVIAGEAVSLIHDVPTAGEIVERIVAQAGKLLSARAAIPA